MKDAYNFILNDLNLKYGDAIVVGVSGGPDSMALLHLLLTIQKELELSIICGHINHNVRKESEEEEKSLSEYCAQNGIIFESMKIEDYGDDNFHNEARTKRYYFFGKLIKKYHAKYLFTAHHADDLMETILMRIVRGSTLRGYSGFSKILEINDYMVVRPLIEVTKEQILSYNKKNKLKYAIDASNEKDVYTRNRYRKYVLPFLKEEDKNVHKKFIKFSNTLLAYNDYIDREVYKIMDKIYKQEVLNIMEFKKLEKIIQNEIIYNILEDTYEDDLMLIYDRHVELILNLIFSDKANGFIYLPNGVKALKEYGGFRITYNEQSPFLGFEIEIIDCANLPNGKNIEVVSVEEKTSNEIIRLNSSEIKLPLYVRNREDGDRISIKGSLGRAKVKDIFIDKKISLDDRKIYPVVVDSDGLVIWIPGLKKSKYDKNKNENYDIILKYY